MSKKNDTTGKVVLSLLAGAAAGAVAGLLLAPETGEETRESFKKSAAKLGNDLNKLFQDSLGKVRTAAGQNVPNDDAAVSEDSTAADELFNSMDRPRGAGRQPAARSGDDYAATAGL